MESCRIILPRLTSFVCLSLGTFSLFSLRVPAAVLGSIIMKEMYALQNTPPASMRDWDIEKRIDKSKGWRTLR